MFPLHRHDQADDTSHRAQRPHNAELDGAEVACDQKNDIVEVGVVIETTDPRLVRRAGLGGRRQRQDSGSQKKTDQAAQNHNREIK